MQRECLEALLGTRSICVRVEDGGGWFPPKGTGRVDHMLCACLGTSPPLESISYFDQERPTYTAC